MSSSEKAEMIEKVAKPTGLRAWILVAAVIIPATGYFLNLVMQGFGAWWNYPLIFPIPFFWILVLLYLLSKFSSKFKLTSQELTLLFVICYITAGSYYAAQGIGYWTTTPITNWSIAHSTSGLNIEAYKDIFYKNVPSFIVPKDPAVMRAFWYGGSFDLGPWLIPILFWIVWSVTEFSTLWFWGYMLRRPLIEVERLPFPWMTPVSFLINNYTQEKITGKPNLFNLRESSIKLFYVGFILGMILSIPGQVISFWPLAFGGNALTNFPIRLIPITQSALPGALTNGNLYVTDLFFAQLIPLDVLATAVLWWFIWGVLFSTTAVRLGINPYTPGAGNEYSYAYSLGVFKWAQFDALVTVGIALYVVVKYHKHILGILKKGFFGEHGDDGVPYNVIAYGAIGTLLVQIFLFAITGTPILMAVIIPIFYVFIMFAWIRIMGEQHFFPYGGSYQGVVFDIGTFLGQWGSRPSPQAFNAILMYTSLGLGGSRMSPMNIHWGLT
jgi:hypothetical protein